MNSLDIEKYLTTQPVHNYSVYVEDRLPAHISPSTLWWLILTRTSKVVSIGLLSTRTEDNRWVFRQFWSATITAFLSQISQVERSSLLVQRALPLRCRQFNLRSLLSNLPVLPHPLRNEDERLCPALYHQLTSRQRRFVPKTLHWILLEQTSEKKSKTSTTTNYHYLRGALSFGLNL